MDTTENINVLLNKFPLPQIDCIHIMYSDVYEILRMLYFSLS